MIGFNAIKEVIFPCEKVNKEIDALHQKAYERNKEVSAKLLRACKVVKGDEDLIDVR